MKKLTKLLLINWHYIDYQLLEFDNINFLTGNNGAGKSTIIDAIQLLLLGNPKGNYFNKAANEKAARTLEGYLRGEMGDDGDAGFKYKRTGKFTSYITAEFLDTISKKYFVIGVVFDVYKDKDFEYKFFSVDKELPDNHFIENDIPFSLKDLKVFLNQKYGNKNYTIYPSNSEYQSSLLGKLGGLNKKFFELFRKSVTFTPIDKIDDFIVNYICNIKNNVNINEMRENIRHYTELEKEANNIKKRIEELENIEKQNNKYLNECSKRFMQEYLIDRSEKEYIAENIEQLIKEKNNLVDELEKINKNNAENHQKIEVLKNEIDALEKILRDSDIAKIADTLTSKIDAFKDKIRDIEEKSDFYMNKLRNYILEWEAVINKTDKELLIKEDLINCFRNFADNVKYLSKINKDNIKEINFVSIEEMTDSSQTLIDYGQRTHWNLERTINDNNAKIQDLTKEINLLENGINVFDKRLINFKNLLELKLKEKFNVDIHVEILADLLEIKNETWRNAIEGYLNTQREYLIVEPKYFEEASKIYRDISNQNKEYHSFGIVDVEKVIANKKEIQKNSLAEEIISDNEYAKGYIDYILGGVIKCDTVEELRRYNTAITSDCMLYRSYVMRRINPEIYKYPHIGKSSILRQKQIKTEEKKELQEYNEKCNLQLKNAEILEKIRVLSDDFIDGLKRNKDEIDEKEEYISESKKLQKEYDELDLAYIQSLENSKKEKSRLVDSLNDEISIAREKRAIILDTIKRNEEDTENKNNELHEKEKSFYEKYTKEWEEAEGNDRYIRERNTKLPQEINKNYLIQIEKTKNAMNQLKNELVQIRTSYINTYNLSYNCQDDSNIEFNKALENLRDIELPKYIESIKDAKEKAFEQFREDFLAKLKSNIDDVHRQIKELNDALQKHSFGGEQYIFKVSPKEEYKKFYSMITDPMLMEGYNLTSEQFNSKYRLEIKELFDKLTISASLSQNILESYEKNINQYTDYRTYLNFDLIVKSPNGDEQRLSKTLNKKSGGETQTPFYISILASFAQLYRMNDFSNRRDSLINLIVFDEAFSKMDSERIEESIKLLQKFDFQAVIAAPSERAAHIIPFVDSTFCVCKQESSIIVGKFENKEEE